MKLLKITTSVLASTAAAIPTAGLVKRDGPNAAPFVDDGMGGTMPCTFALGETPLPGPSPMSPSKITTLAVSVIPNQGQKFNLDFANAIISALSGTVENGTNGVSVNCGTIGSAACADLNPNGTVVAKGLITSANIGGVNASVYLTGRTLDINQLDQAALLQQFPKALNSAVIANKPKTSAAFAKTTSLASMALAAGVAVLLNA